MKNVKRLVGLLLLVLMAMTAAMSVSNAEQSGVPLPAPAKAVKGEQCVEPADIMRRNHMDYLKHQRDETVREGIRGKKYSFNACVDCHAVADPKIAGGKIRTLQPFCGECHHYAAVHADCFACHNPTAPLLGNSDVDDKALKDMIAAHLKNAGGDQ